MDEKELNREELNQKELNLVEANPDPSVQTDITGDWHKDICQGIIMAYFLVVAVIYPFYAPGGYMRIGEVKYIFFRNISLVTLAVMTGTILLSIVVRRDWKWVVRNYRSMSVTDWFAYSYFVAIMLSYLCSAYKKDALWGAEGWYMGVVTQIIFVFLYFFFSRYFHCDIRWIVVWLLAAVGVFLLGICNRYSVYPIVLEGQTATFISTLGNINWFCGYWSVIAPVGITLYWCSDKVWVRVLAAVCSVITMLSGVTQGSNSAFLVFIVMLLTLFVLSLGSSERMYRLLELCMLFAVGCLFGKFMQFLPNLQYNYMPIEGDFLSDITSALLTRNAALWMLIVVLICYVFLRISERRGLLHIEGYAEKNSRFKSLLIAAVIVAACVAAVVSLSASDALYTHGMSETSGDDNFHMTFNEDWGHGRGAAWNIGINAYRSMDILHKIVGIGPDCFADYVYDLPELAERVIAQFTNQRLTNTHNEQLTLLVNVGVLGWFCYAGLFLTAFVRYVRRADKQPLLYLCAVSILAYMAHNMVSFQQVLSTPYVFIVLGIGERFYRSTLEKNYMSSNPGGIDSKENRPMNTGLKMTEQVTEYLLAVMIIVLCVAVAFYAKDGYHKIGNAKFAAYKNVMIIGCTVLLTMMVPYVFFYLREHRRPWISITDGCILAYLILSGIAVVSGGFYEDALWGYTGWNMGLISQISFVLLYLFLSRFGKYYRLLLAVLCMVACIVYTIGILHRLLIDPIGFYDELTDNQKAQFLSTLGQNTWYGSFLAVTLPVGMGVFLYTVKKVWRIFGGIFMMIGFCTLVTQNSDSAYFALAGALLIFFMLSSKKREVMCRFMGALTLFFAAGKIMYFLTQIHLNPKLEPDFMTGLMWTSGVTWALLVICLIATIILYAMGTKPESWKYPKTLIRRLCQVVPAAMIVVVVGVVLLIILQTQGKLPEPVAYRLADVSYFNWDDSWGNGRGRIWRFSAKMFSEMDMRHKLFGVGPDCFHSYVSACYSEEETLLWGDKQLTNAHNEWLNMLINVGILGTAAYLGIYVTAIRRFFCESKQNILLAGIAAACISYVCYNFFCYQQVLCTPFIFLLMGIGEYIFRELSGKENSAE